MRVLAIQLKRIGDLILTTPALSALAAHGHAVSLVVDGGCASLLPAIPDLDGALVYDKRGTKRGFWGKIRAGKWDAVLDFTGNDRSAFMTLLSGAGRRVTFEWVRQRWWKRLVYREYVDSSVRLNHTCDHYLDLARALGVAERKPQPALIDSSAGWQVAEGLLEGSGVRGRYLLIHPGTARAEKYWVERNWAVVIERLQRLGAAVIITTGPDPFERAHVRRILEALGLPVPVLGPPSLEVLSSLVAHAAVVASCDTSVVHLAAAFARPQVALFGPTNPFHWRPRHEQAVIFSAANPLAPLTDFLAKMKGAPMEQLQPEPVIAALERLWSSASASEGRT